MVHIIAEGCLKLEFDYLILCQTFMNITFHKLLSCKGLSITPSPRDPNPDNTVYK